MDSFENLETTGSSNSEMIRPLPQRQVVGCFSSAVLMNSYQHGGLVLVEEIESQGIRLGVEINPTTGQERHHFVCKLCLNGCYIKGVQNGLAEGGALQNCEIVKLLPPNQLEI